MTASEKRLGEVLRDGQRRGLRYQRRLAHPPEKVWSAVTESEHLRQWFPADIVGERRAGATLSFPFWPELVAANEIEEPVLPGELRVWEPPRTLELIWGGDLLRWDLEPDGENTFLVFTAWLGEDSPAGLAGTGAGYHLCLDALQELLDTGSTTPLADLEPGPLEKLYQELAERT